MRKVVLGLGLLLASVVYADVVSQNGIAKDSATGLVWQDDSARVDWYEAKQYCEDLRLGGFKDWRVPNRFELTTLIDSTKKNEPHLIDGFEAKLPKGAEGYLWSSDSCDHDSEKGWLLFINSDYVGDTFKKYENFKKSVRCVRGAKLTFNSLQKLKNSGKLKVPQASIDGITPMADAERKKYASSRANKTSENTSYKHSTYTTGYKFNNHATYSPQSYESTEIKCSNGKNGTIFNYYNNNSLYHYFAETTKAFQSFEEAANYICGNK